MCDASSGVPGVTVPRPAPGAAVDPIALEPVDELLVTTLVDNVYDALLTGDERTRRVPINVATTAAPGAGRGTATPGTPLDASHMLGWFQGRASKTRLNGVSAARRKRVNPAAVTTSRIAASPAWAPSADPPGWESALGTQR